MAAGGPSMERPVHSMAAGDPSMGELAAAMEAGSAAMAAGRGGMERVDRPAYTPMKSRCAKLRSSRARRTLSAASSMSYSMRLNSKRFLSLS